MLTVAGFVVLVVMVMLVMVPRVRLSRDVVGRETNARTVLDRSGYSGGLPEPFGPYPALDENPTDGWTDSSHTAHYTGGANPAGGQHGGVHHGAHGRDGDSGEDDGHDGGDGHGGGHRT
jgi:hypothetical protein